MWAIGGHSAVFPRHLATGLSPLLGTCAIVRLVVAVLGVWCHAALPVSEIAGAAKHRGRMGGFSSDVETLS
jgi:hypothetical protein